MNFRLKTTKQTATILKNLHNSTGLTPNILSRIAIALSLLDPEIPEYVNSESEGLEFNRNTLTGEFDYIYKALIKQHAGKDVPEEDYFPGLFNAHLERGVKLLENEYKHAGNFQKLLNNLIRLCDDNLEVK